MSTYILRHFPIQARPETCRALLSYDGGDYTSEHPSWPLEKSKQPFGKVPVLIETDAMGNVFQLSDSMAIEHYLATKKGLMVDSSPQDRARQDELRSQILDIFLFAPQYRFASEVDRVTIKKQYVTQVKFFIDFHEKHLMSNGSNGHYFSDKITYVDIALVATMRALRRFGDESMPGMTRYLSPDRAPLINKVLDVVGNDPKLAKYFSEPRVKPAVL